MNSSQYKNIQDPIARAEAMRAEAIANAIFDGAVALRNLAKAAAAKVSGYFEYRRTVDVLSGMTDRELDDIGIRSDEHTSELQSLMRISYAVFCWKKKKHNTKNFS